MNLHFKVNSTAIRKIAYDSNEKRLSITFNSNKTYDYPNVPAQLVCNFMKSPSKGQFFNKEIRNKFQRR